MDRIASHASGRFSGDQFAVYVANRYVVPELKAVELPLFASGELSLDALTKAYIPNTSATRLPSPRLPAKPTT